MNIHLQSDVHLEFGKPFTSYVASDVIVCAGDIGTTCGGMEQLRTYFKSLKDNAKHVIWVLGNHEYYNAIYEHALEDAQTLADQEGIHLLDVALGTQDLELDGVKFWGTTFWTDLKGHDHDVHKIVQAGLSDFITIRHPDGTRFSAHESYEINKKSRELINWNADVIITHHCPIDIKHPHFDSSDISYAFVNTGLEETIMDSNVKHWLYGHNHWSDSHDLNGTNVVSNQRGYVRNGDDEESQWLKSNYNPSLLLHV